MSEENGPTVAALTVAIGGLLVIAAITVGLLILAILFPIFAVMFASAAGGCATIAMGVRFINRILDPREAPPPSR